MFCNNCGAKIEDGAKFCDSCGAATGAAPVEKTVENTGKGLMFATIVLSIINAVIPFLNWVEVPALNTLSSLFGGSDTAASYSLFGYIFAGESDSVITTVVILILALISVVSVIFNIVYCVKAFQGNIGAKKYGTIGSALLLTMSVLFLIIVGLISLIIKIIKLTSIVYIAIILSVVNIVLLKKSKNS